MKIEKIKKMLSDSEIKVINLGLSSFAETLLEQNVEVIHIDWRPPAEDDQELIDILDALRGKD